MQVSCPGWLETSPGKMFCIKCTVGHGYSLVLTREWEHSLLHWGVCHSQHTGQLLIPVLFSGQFSQLLSFCFFSRQKIKKKKNPLQDALQRFKDRLSLEYIKDSIVMANKILNCRCRKTQACQLFHTFHLHNSHSLCLYQILWVIVWCHIAPHPLSKQSALCSMFFTNCSALYPPSHPYTLCLGLCDASPTVYDPSTQVCCDGCVSTKPWMHKVMS